MIRSLDLRSSLRNLRRNPGFAAAAALSIALGIGANTAIFSLLNQVLLRPLAVRNPEGLLVLHSGGGRPLGMSASDVSETVFSYPMYRDLRDRVPVFAGLIARAGAPVAVSGAGEARRMRAEIVSGNFFEVLGVRPLLGRLIASGDDERAGAHPVVVLGYDAWVNRFGRDPAALNRKITVNGHPMVVIGVAAPGFRSIVPGQTPDLFVPIALKREATPTWDERENRRAMWLNLMARLKPGISPRQGEAALSAVLRPILEEELAQMGPPRSSRWAQNFLETKVELRPAPQGINQLRETMRTPLAVLMAIVGLVLLIACFKVANLLLARATARDKEIAVRIALGADRWSLARLLLTESLLLAAAGGAAGVLLSFWMVDPMLSAVPGHAGAGWLSTRLDARVLLFTLALTGATALLVGLLPALQATRANPGAALKDQQTSSTASRGRQRWRGALVTAQVALAMALLAGAGLFVRTLTNLMRLDPGYRTENLFSFSLDLALSGYGRARGQAFLRELQLRLTGLPGVQAAAAANMAPLTNNNRGANVTVEGHQAAEDEDMNVAVNAVSPGYFATMGIPLLRGREFSDRDGPDAPKVVAVNESFARHFFGASDPIGRRLAFGAGDIKLELQIVGVVKDNKHRRLRERVQRFVYLPCAQDRDVVQQMTFYVRTSREESSMAGAVRALVREMDAGLPLDDLRTMQTIVKDSITAERLVAALSASFGLLAALLACVGIYGVIAFAVARRTSEIGIRMALGALRGDVLWLVMADVVKFLLLGTAIGLAGAVALGRLVESQLFGVVPYDALALAPAVAVLSAAGLLAGLLPALRATRIEPTAALRYE